MIARRMIVKRMSFLFLCFALLVFPSCGGERERTVHKGAVKAAIMRLEAFQVPLVREFPGRVQAKVKVTLAGKVSGYVKEVMVEEGQQVKKGALLVVLDDGEIRDKIEALREAEKALRKDKAAMASRLEYARLTFKRYAQLLKEEAVTKEEYDRARSRYRALVEDEKALTHRIEESAARLRSMTHTLRYTQIRSPVDGVVTARWVDPGTYVSPGDPLLALDDLGGGYWFVAQVDEAYLPKLRRGQRVGVYLESLGATYPAHISLVVPKVDPRTGGVKVKVDISSQPVRSGMFGRLLLPVDSAPRVLIPWLAVVQRGNLTAVYAVDKDNMIHFRLIRTGRSYKKTEDGWLPVEISNGTASKRLWVEVLGGLDPGDTLVTTNLEQLEEGMRLEQ